MHWSRRLFLLKSHKILRFSWWISKSRKWHLFTKISSFLFERIKKVLVVLLMVSRKDVARMKIMNKRSKPFVTMPLKMLWQWRAKHLSEQHPNLKSMVISKEIIDGTISQRIHWMNQIMKKRSEKEMIMHHHHDKN